MDKYREVCDLLQWVMSPWTEINKNEEVTLVYVNRNNKNA